MATCPNCTARIRQTAPECPSCGALFGAGSAWKPVADSTDTPGGARAHQARSTPAAARGDIRRILARIQQFLRDERIDAPTRDALQEFSDAVSNLDTPFRELISDSAARLARLAESHRFSEALWEIDLLKELPFDSLDVPRWDEDDFYARIYPGYIRRVNDAVRSRRLVQQVALAQGRVESLANDQEIVAGKNDLTGTDGRTSRRQPATAQNSPRARTGPGDSGNAGETRLRRICDCRHAVLYIPVSGGADPELHRPDHRPASRLLRLAAAVLCGIAGHTHRGSPQDRRPVRHPVFHGHRALCRGLVAPRRHLGANASWRRHATRSVIRA